MWFCSSSKHVTEPIKMMAIENPSLINIPEGPFECKDKTIVYKVISKWAEHVNLHRCEYAKLCIQDEEIIRDILFKYDRSIGIVGHDGATYYPAIATPYTIIKPVYNDIIYDNENDQYHVNLCIQTIHKLQNLFARMDHQFPFVCRYYKYTDKDKYWGKRAFINPLKEELPILIEVSRQIYKDWWNNKKIKQYINPDRREYYTWFVINKIKDMNKEEFYEADEIIFNLILLNDYLHDLLNAHYKAKK